MSRPSPWSRPLPLNPELALAATAFFLWLLAHCLQVRIGSSLLELKVVVGDPHWRPQWPLGPWLLGVAGLGLAWVLSRRSPAIGVPTRLRQWTLLAALLLALRLAALLPPVSALLPFLSLLWSPHTTWALAAALLLHLNAPLLPSLSIRALAWGLLGVCAAVYTLWSLYFCQTTMPHG
ncbi:MAG: hypothetical protein FJY95_17025, partial [Candidatus Handelsmanbacteria bacterium]|nr:hypothetical protein [Candidatus Handelsmanbacteria bacterium]